MTSLSQPASKNKKDLCCWSETRWHCQCWTKRTLSICPRLSRAPCSCKPMDWPIILVHFLSFAWLFSGICLHVIMMAAKTTDSSCLSYVFLRVGGGGSGVSHRLLQLSVAREAARLAVQECFQTLWRVSIPNLTRFQITCTRNVPDSKWNKMWEISKTSRYVICLQIWNHKKHMLDYSSQGWLLAGGGC